MSGVAQPPVREEAFTPSGLREKARPLHQPRIALWNYGWICVGAALALSLIGYFAIESTTRPDYAVRHAMHLAVGLLAGSLVVAPHFRIAQRLSYVFLLIVIGLLIFLLIPAVPEWIVRPRNGARRWINLYFMDFQPSELAKIAYVVSLATYLRFRSNYRTLRGLLLPLLLTFIPLVLILIEPDLGTAMLFLPTLFAMLIAAGGKIWHLVLIITLGLSLAPLTYPLLEPHQKDRIRAQWAQIQGDPQYESDIGYQGARAMTLVGAGGLTGVGKDLAADLVRYNRLPENHNDMIFAVICCRWGVLGAIGIWGLFVAFAIGGLLVAGECRDPFGRLVCVGLVTIVFVQMVINTGMTIGLLPITGLTLPFVSYGGSSMVAVWMKVGLILNIGLRRPQNLSRHSFEFDEPADEPEDPRLYDRFATAR